MNSRYKIIDCKRNTNGKAYKFTVYDNVGQEEFVFTSIDKVYRTYYHPNGDFYEEFSISEDKIDKFQLYYACAQNNGLFLKHIPEIYKTYDLCTAAVSSDGYCLSDVPKKIRNEKLCSIAVSNRASAIKYVPDKYQSPEILKLAVQRSYKALKHISSDKITKELCMIGINQNLIAISFVPEEYKVELYLETIKEGKKFEVSKDVSKEQISQLKEYLNEQILIKSMQTNGLKNNISNKNNELRILELEEQKLIQKLAEVRDKKKILIKRK